MKLHLEVDPNNEQDLAQAFAVLHSFSSRPAAPTEQPIKAAVQPKKTEKSESKAAKKAEETPKDPGTDDGYGIDDVRARISELLKSGKRAEVKALLKQFDATSATSLDEANFADFMAAAEEL